MAVEVLPLILHHCTAAAVLLVSMSISPALTPREPAVRRRRLSRPRLIDGFDTIENLAEIELRDLKVIVVFAD